MSMDKELYKLEILSLVSRVSQELFNHTKLQDKNLAEFVIAVSPCAPLWDLLTSVQLHEQGKSFDTFRSKLGEIGADFPESFIKNLDRLIVTMHPRYKRRAAKAKAAVNKSGKGFVVANGDRDLQARKFPGLSVPDQEWKPVENYLADRATIEPVMDKLPSSISVDDTMAELAAAASRLNRPAAEDFLDRGPTAKRPRNGDYGGDGRGPAGRSGQVPSALDNGNGIRGKDYDHRDNGYGNRENRNGTRNFRPSPTDERPVLYKIYNGSVQNLRDFGAFVSLEGVQGKAEGEFSHLQPADDRHGACFQCHQLPHTKPGRSSEAQRSRQSEGHVGSCG